MGKSVAKLREEGRLLVARPDFKFSDIGTGFMTRPEFLPFRIASEKAKRASSLIGEGKRQNLLSA
jgi:hypothetical protein